MTARGAPDLEDTEISQTCLLSHFFFCILVAVARPDVGRPDHPRPRLLLLISSLALRADGDRTFKPALRTTSREEEGDMCVHRGFAWKVWGRRRFGAHGPFQGLFTLTSGRPRIAEASMRENR